MRIICSILLFSAVSSITTTPPPSGNKGRLVANLDQDYGINIAGSPIFEHYRKARIQTDYLDREMSKLGTNQIPNFKPIKASEDKNLV